MVKALFINGADDMQLGTRPDLIPNRHEGWGAGTWGTSWSPGLHGRRGRPILQRRPAASRPSTVDQSVVFNNNADQYQIRLVPADVTQP